MLIAYLEKEKIDTCIWSTSVLRLVENLKGLDAAKPTSLKMIMFSGEVMPNKILNYWRRHLPEVTYVNLYGPTEITCNCSFYIVDRSYNDDDVLPIGRQFKNTEIFILTEDHKEAEIDEIGEICVRGSSLALGYYNNPEVTEKVFVQNPLNTHYRDLIYKTGDLGRVSNDGLLYFISRKDHQIKHMGHRIELGEIEVVANSIGKINMACCIFDKAKEKIMLFYEAAEESNKEIYREMLLKLPKYMIPNKMIWFDKLPLNKNGKIDRVYLKKVHIDEQA
jgi:non-ribosomal peptide synthetase component F